MPTTIRFIVQAAVAGVVAALLLLGARSLTAQAQWGGEVSPEPTATASATTDPTSEPSAEPTAESTAEPTAAEPTTDTTTQTTSGTTSVDACALITQPEAEAALGVAANPVGDSGQCTYVAADLTGRSVSVALSPVPPSEDGVVQAAMAQLAEAMGAELRQADIGDEGSIILADLLAQASVRVGGQMLVVVLTAPSGAADQQAATLTDLARAAAARL